MEPLHKYEHGAQRLEDGKVRFRLWAPAVEQVTLHLGDQAHEMERLEGGWFESLQECPPGATYLYEPGNCGKVPDPASRLQQSDVHGPSVVLDHASYPWKHADWRGRPWAETVLYELHAGLLGGFAGVRARLSELAELGITAIELMPIAEFPGERNWGYDGVLPYAPDRAYGSPDELKALIDEAHGLGMMVFLDVVYNHFGPVGNYLNAYAPTFFRDDVKTPWGSAIDFRQAAVRSFFSENALYWLKEYRFDGLRFDAVHAIVGKEDWLGKLSVWLRERLPGREVHLVLENDDNTASLLRHGYDAQWNDDAHHVMHHLLTGETRGYYAAYAERATEKLARALAQGFVYQGEPSPAHDGRPRGEPSYMLPTTSFVFFLQNHDQVGNRAVGERLTALCRQKPAALQAAISLQLLSPFIPLIFMGEEAGSETPFLYFTSFDDPEFAAAVREGRRSEFPDFHGHEQDIPDPNAVQSWKTSLPGQGDEAQARAWRDRYRELLALRARYIAPFLKGAQCDSVVVLADGCVAARWVLGDGSRLSLYSNLSAVPVDVAAGLVDPEESLFHESMPGASAALLGGTLPAHCTLAGLRAAEAQQESAA